MRRIIAFLLVCVCVALTSTHAHATDVVVWKQATASRDNFQLFLEAVEGKGLVQNGGLESVALARLACVHSLTNGHPSHVGQFQQLSSEQQRYAVSFCESRFLGKYGWIEHRRSGILIAFGDFFAKGQKYEGFPMPFLDEVLIHARGAGESRARVTQLQQQVVAPAASVTPQQLAGVRKQLLAEIARLESLHERNGHVLEQWVINLRALIQRVEANEATLDKHHDRLTFLEDWIKNFPENIAGLKGLLDAWDWFEENCWWIKIAAAILALLLLGWLLWWLLSGRRKRNVVVQQTIPAVIVDDEARRLANEALRQVEAAKEKAHNAHLIAASTQGNVNGLNAVIAAVPGTAQKATDEAASANKLAREALEKARQVGDAHERSVAALRTEGEQRTAEWKERDTQIDERLDGVESRLTTGEEKIEQADRRSIEALVLASQAVEMADIAFTIAANSAISFDSFPENEALAALPDKESVTFRFVHLDATGRRQIFPITVTRGENKNVNGKTVQTLYVKGFDRRRDGVAKKDGADDKGVETTVENFRRTCGRALKRHLAKSES